MTLTLGAGLMGLQEPVLALVSSMRSRRRVDLADDRAALLRLATLCSSLARERSQKELPFSVVARSLSWLMQRVPVRVWAVSLTCALYSSSFPLSPASLDITLVVCACGCARRTRCVASRSYTEASV